MAMLSDGRGGTVHGAAYGVIGAYGAIPPCRVTSAAT